MEIKEHTEGQQKGREGKRRVPRSRIDGRVHHTPTGSIRRYIGNRIVSIENEAVWNGHTY